MQALFGELRWDVTVLTVLYSLAGLGIAIVNDFKSIEGDRWGAAGSCAATLCSGQPGGCTSADTMFLYAKVLNVQPMSEGPQHTDKRGMPSAGNWA